jgi:hypothetical protein
MFGRKLLRCSFCGKDETRVAKLVAGSRAFICDLCTAAAARIISSGDNDDPPPPAPQARSSFFRRVWRFLRGHYRQSMPCQCPVARALGCDC